MARKRPTKWLKVAREAGASFDPAEKPQWISRILTRAGALAPGEVDAALRNGRVTLSGKTVRGAMTLVRAADDVRLDGKPVSQLAPTLVLMFHKPKGVVTAPTDPELQGTVFERLDQVLTEPLKRYGWHAVGRLDRNTTGLLLFTNDERFVSHATLPGTHLAKTYVAKIQGTATDEKLEPLRKGLSLHDGETRPASAKLRSADTVELTITEGRNHQVKHMLGAVGLPVIELHRERIGEIVIDVEEGQFRELTLEEIKVGLGFSAARAP